MVALGRGAAVSCAGRTLLILAAIGPWLGLVRWESPVTGVVTASLTLAASFHGLGLAAARLVRRPIDGPLAIQWGIAVALGLQGIALLFHVANRAESIALVAAGLIVHTSVLLWQQQRRSRWLQERLGGEHRARYVIIALLLAALGLLQMLGTAGDVGERPFDDEGNLHGQLARLLDTGALDDPVGYPRATQLGGQLVLAGLGASLTGDVPGIRWLDSGLCFVLTVGLALSRLRIQDRSAMLWALLLLFTLSALAFVPADPSAWWSAVGLMLALYLDLQTKPQQHPAIPVGVIAGALTTLRYEFALVAAVSVIAVGWPRDATWPPWPRRAALATGAAAIIVFAYAIARTLAWNHDPQLAELIAPVHGRSLTRLGLFALVFVSICPILVLASARDPGWPAIATAAGMAGIISQLAGARPYATRFLWPIVLALALVVVVDLARDVRPRTLALGVSLLACALIYEGRNVGGRVRWSRRWTSFVDNIESLHRGVAVHAGYELALAKVPPGARLAAWVGHPERLDYRRHQVFDLRTPRMTKLRTHRWAPHSSRIASVLQQIDAEYLLLEQDHASIHRSQRDILARFWCARPRPGCADDLEAIAYDLEPISHVHNIQLFRLR